MALQHIYTCTHRDTHKLLKSLPPSPTNTMYTHASGLSDQRVQRDGESGQTSLVLEKKCRISTPPPQTHPHTEKGGGRGGSESERLSAAPGFLSQTLSPCRTVIRLVIHVTLPEPITLCSVMCISIQSGFPLCSLGVQMQIYSIEHIFISQCRTTGVFMSTEDERDGRRSAVQKSWAIPLFQGCHSNPCTSPSSTVIFLFDNSLNVS